MELNVADLLLGGEPYDYKLSSLRLQLKDGGIEIGPQAGSSSSADEDEDGVSKLILQVYNESAEEVEIEYQPATKQDDTRWGFWCDGRILKTVVPYKFWKSHWNSERDDAPHHLHQTLGIAASSSASLNAGIKECGDTDNNTVPLSLDSSYLMADGHICNCQSQKSDVKRPRQVSRVLIQPRKAGSSKSCSASSGSDSTRVIKVRCQRPGSPASSEEFERAIKVRCAKPESSLQVSVTETKVRCSRPASPADISETATTSQRAVESRCLAPCSTTEALERVKEALATIQVFEPLTRAGPGSSREASEMLTRPGCPALCLPTEATLARAKDAVARVNGIRPPPRPASSTSFSGRSSKSVSTREVYVRAVTAATSPINLSPPVLKRGISLDTADLMKCFSGDTSDLIDTFSRGTSNHDLCRHRESMLVGQVIVRDAQKLEIKDVWKAAFDKFMSKEKANILKQGRKSKEFLKVTFDKFISKEKANILKHSRKSKVFLKETFEFISKEKAAFIEHGKKYVSSKRKELALARLECIFCLCVAPSLNHPDGTMSWKSFNDLKSWKTMVAGGHQNHISLVSTGTNTAICTPRNADGQSQT